MKKNNNEWLEFWFDVLKLFILYSIINIGLLYIITKYF